jgi:tRNA (cmo5U34)-methyltransferase
MKTEEWVSEFNEEKAEAYDSFIDKFIPGYFAFQDLLLSLISHKIEENKISIPKILVIGAGTGNESLKLAQAFNNSQIVAIEPSPEMFTKLTSKLELADLNNIDCFNCYLDELEAYNFDFVISSLVMHFIEDNGQKQNFINTVFSKLKKPGAFILVDKMINETTDDIDLNLWREFLISKGKSLDEATSSMNNIKKELNRISSSRLKELSKNFSSIYEFFRALHLRGYVLEKC